MSSGTRTRALSLYRSILRTARAWEGGAEEQQYIKREARSQFQQYKELTDTAQIQAKLQEGEERLQLGIHYRIPYPRLHHAPQFKRRDYQDIPIIK